jgi:hypothetical protein
MYQKTKKSISPILKVPAHAGAYTPSPTAGKYLSHNGKEAASLLSRSFLAHFSILF